MIYEMKFDFCNGILLGIEGIRQNYQQLPLLMKQVIFTGIDNIIQILLRFHMQILIGAGFDGDD